MTTEAAPRYSPTNNHALILGVPIAEIQPSPLNPRRTFSPEALAELAASITSHGLLEPLVVRVIAEDPKAGLVGPYELIAGERRWRACQIAGLTQVPARVLVGIDEKTALEMMMIENLQRQDLDPLEEAAGYKALQTTCGMTQTQIAAAVHRSQPAVAKAIGLLRLPEAVQTMVRDGQLSPTHAQALVRFADFPDVCTHIATAAVRQQWTTKQLAEQDVPNAWELQQAGLVKDVRDHEAHFDMRICKSACPHAAYISRYDNFGFCLRPDHYKQLQAEADAAEKKRLLEASRAAKAQAPGEKAETAVSLPRIETLKNYESFQYSKPPANCTELCPCRASALDREGRVVRICTDPKHLAQLKAQATRAENAAKRTAEREQRTKLTARLEAIRSVETREMALLVCGILQGRSGKKPVRAAADVLVPGLGDVMQAYDTFTKAMPLLAAQDLVTLMRLATTIVLLDDLAQEWGNHEKVTWWLTSASGITDPGALINVLASEERPLATYAPTPMIDALVDGDELATPERRTKVEKLTARLDASHDPTERAVLAQRLVDAAIHADESAEEDAWRRCAYCGTHTRPAALDDHDVCPGCQQTYADAEPDDAARCAECGQISDSLGDDGICSVCAGDEEEGA